MFREKRRGRGGKPGPHRGRGGRRRHEGPAPFDAKDPFRGRKEISIEECGFAGLGLDERLVKALAHSGYSSLTGFQKECLPLLLEGKSVIARAGDSAGRTVGFLVPLIQRLTEREGPRILVVTPTRNLATQVYNEIRRLTFFRDEKTALLDADARISRQAEVLEEGPSFVVGTPGRILDHIRRGNALFGDLDGTVLAEVDRILDQGQRNDVEEIVAKIGDAGQVVQITATVSPAVLRFCRQNVSEAVELFDDDLALGDTAAFPEAEREAFVRVDPRRKRNALVKLLEEERPRRAMVFCRGKESAVAVAGRLDASLGHAEEIHAGMAPRRRREIAERFRGGEFNILVVTDAGIADVGAENVTHGVNYDIPETAEDYLFRFGRVARLGPAGAALTLVESGDDDLLKRIQNDLGRIFTERTLSGFDEAPERGERSRGIGSEGRGRREPRRDRKEEGRERGERRESRRERTGEGSRPAGEIRRDEREDRPAWNSSRSAGRGNGEKADFSPEDKEGAGKERPGKDKKPSNENLFHGGWFRKLKRRR